MIEVNYIRYIINPYKQMVECTILDLQKVEYIELHENTHTFKDLETAENNYTEWLANHYGYVILSKDESKIKFSNINRFFDDMLHLGLLLQTKTD